jgi:hypothetical protein
MDVWESRYFQNTLFAASSAQKFDTAKHDTCISDENKFVSECGRPIKSFAFQPVERAIFFQEFEMKFELYVHNDLSEARYFQNTLFCCIFTPEIWHG